MAVGRFVAYLCNQLDGSARGNAAKAAKADKRAADLLLVRQSS